MARVRIYDNNTTQPTSEYYPREVSKGHGGELGGSFHKGTRKGSGILDQGGRSKKQGPWTVGTFS